MTTIRQVWGPAPSHLVLTGDDVHIWRAQLYEQPARVQRLAELLSIDELTRARAFFFPGDRDRFVVGRAILRMVLSRYLGLHPRRVQFRYGPYGKPTLAQAFKSSPYRFNVSHSRRLALIAVAYEREVGVDLEYLRPLPDLDLIVDDVLSSRENEMFRSLPGGLKQEAFYRCWTRKEAFVKANGRGLTYPLAGIEVSLAPDEPARIISVDGSTQCSDNWSLRDLLPGNGFVSALAAEGHIRHIATYHWFPDI